MSIKVGNVIFTKKELNTLKYEVSEHTDEGFSQKDLTAALEKYFADFGNSKNIDYGKLAEFIEDMVQERMEEKQFKKGIKIQVKGKTLNIGNEDLDTLLKFYKKLHEELTKQILIEVIKMFLKEEGKFLERCEKDEWMSLTEQEPVGKIFVLIDELLAPF